MDENVLNNLLAEQYCKISRKVVIFLCLCAFLIIVSVIFDKMNLFNLACMVKYLDLNSFFEIVSTMDTILGASVIFFYTIQNNRSVGMPHRVIMAHSFGSFSVPIIFFIAIIMIPLIWLLKSLNMLLVAFIALCITIILQILLVVFILLTVSYRYCIQVICDVEKKQFLFLTFLKEKKGKDLLQRTISPYLYKYMEYVVKSDEIIVDKAIILRRLLRIPFCKKDQPWLNLFLLMFERFERIDISGSEYLQKDKKWELYSFYFNNLVPVFEYLAADIRTEERNRFYLILYEFVDELNHIYFNPKAQEQEKGNYHIVVSAIMNAALASTAVEKEEFCNFIFKEYIQDKKTRTVQIGLYILFQEFLYSTDVIKVQLKSLGAIKQYIREWKADVLNKQIESQQGSKDKINLKEMYVEFWEIWSEWTSISQINSYQHLQMALNTIFQEGFDSIPIAYIINTYGRKWV